MPIATMREYTSHVLPKLSPVSRTDRGFSTALELIRTSRILDLNSEDVNALHLDLQTWIAGLLAFSRENHFIKFDPWDPAIAIRHFPDSCILYQYNPFRDVRNRKADGQAALGGEGKKTDFLAWETFPESEHYLIWTARSENRYRILSQVAPIVPQHLIIASLDRDPATGDHFEQTMTPDRLADMQELEMELASCGYAVGFNSQHAGASVDHFHTQAVPAGYLPLTGFVSNPAARFEQCAASPRGLTVKILGPLESGSGSAGYPARGVLLEAGDPAVLLDAKLALLTLIRARGWAYNSLGWKVSAAAHAEVFFPRGPESILNSALKAGYVEMSGMLVIPDRELFSKLSEPLSGEQGMLEAGLERGLFQSLLEWLGVQLGIKFEQLQNRTTQ